MPRLKGIKTKAGTWRRERCGCCISGLDSYGSECRMCWGNGSVWRSPKGRYVLYPGGPFLGGGSYAGEQP